MGAGINFLPLGLVHMSRQKVGNLSNVCYARFNLNEEG